MNILIFIIKFTGIFVCIMMIFHIITKKYLNPYKLIFVFGKKGNGKSTILEKQVYKHLKRGWTVYSTEVPKGQKFIYKKQAEWFDPRNIYKYNFPEHSVLFIDEASIIWDNRNFKNMDMRIIEWFRMMRHLKVKCWLFAQNFEVDAKIRSLADSMYLVEKYFRVFVVAKHMVRKPVVVHPSPDAPARIDDDIIIDSPLLALFGGRLFAFIPYWAKRFNSFRTDTLTYSQDKKDGNGS